MRQLALQVRLRERAVFDSYVPGANLAAVAYLRRLSQRRARAVCWLSGSRGTGKSHLLQAACALAAQGSTALAPPAYLPLAELAQLGAGTLEGWQDRSLIALDDVDAVAGRPEWERALFRLYREAEERGASVLAAARESPQRLPFGLTDLASRFAAATLWPLRPLDEAGQRLALQARARARGLLLSEAAARYLQRRFRRDLPSLCSLLDTIDDAALRDRRRLTVPFIRQVLGEAPDRPHARGPA